MLLGCQLPHVPVYCLTEGAPACSGLTERDTQLGPADREGSCFNQLKQRLAQRMLLAVLSTALLPAGAREGFLAA